MQWLSGDNCLLSWASGLIVIFFYWLTVSLLFRFSTRVADISDISPDYHHDSLGCHIYGIRCECFYQTTSHSQSYCRLNIRLSDGMLVNFSVNISEHVPEFSELSVPNHRPFLHEYVCMTRPIHGPWQAGSRANLILTTISFGGVKLKLQLA